MKTFGFDFVNFGDILSFPTRRAAQNHGNGLTLASTEEELAAANVPTAALVELYNKHSAIAPVKKFTDRPTAFKRIIALAEAKAVPAKVDERDLTEMAKKAAPAPAPSAEEIAAAKAEREKAIEAATADLKAKEEALKTAKEEYNASVAALKTLSKGAKVPRLSGGTGTRGPRGNAGERVLVWDAKNYPENPAREGSLRHASMKVIIEAGPGGITQKDYVAAGGRPADLLQAQAATPNWISVIEPVPSAPAPAPAA